MSQKVYTYYQAKIKAISIEWKTEHCEKGEKCWCRVVAPVKTILVGDNLEPEEYLVINQGMIDKEIAKHIVQVHNEWINTK